MGLAIDDFLPKLKIHRCNCGGYCEQCLGRGWFFDREDLDNFHKERCSNLFYKERCSQVFYKN